MCKIIDGGDRSTVRDLINFLEEFAEEYGDNCTIAVADGEGIFREAVSIVMTNISTTLESCGKEIEW